ncbi:MAG: hypothetical protein HKN50_06680 [Gammaproteobacteria bacterium]|nr:hypothetical protein [Gammaproteobacteria bacterium]
MEQPNFSQINQVDLHKGGGNFVIDGGAAIPGRTITVFYHQPENFNSETPILIVVPGTGRNAWDYRDTWVQHAERNGVLVLAPHYSKEQYDFAAYHMGGVIENFEMNNTQGDSDNRFYIADEDVRFDINQDRSKWLFADFDRLFELVVTATGSNQQSYDLFGHSAGAQIAHRFALFQPDSKAGRIVAANSGFYTLPNLQKTPLFGLAKTGLGADELARSFEKELILLLGESDNADSSGGTMLHSPKADQQGLGRYERGHYFYSVAQMTASTLAMDFNWQLISVPDTDHDFSAMSEAATRYLYDN